MVVVGVGVRCGARLGRDSVHLIVGAHRKQDDRLRPLVLSILEDDPQVVAHAAHPAPGENSA